jgi:cation diffusion facilitator family transporter
MQMHMHMHLLASLILMVAKISFGIVSGSKALVVSAIYSLQECVSAATFLLTIRARNQRGHRRTDAHGLGKITFLVAGGMSILIFLGVAGFCSAILHSLLEHRQRAPQTLALWMALVSAGACWFMSYHARRTDRAGLDPSLRAHAAHCQYDLYASLAVLGSVLAAKMGYQLVDSFVALIQAAHVVICACLALGDAVKGLMDASISAEKIAEIDLVLRDVDGVLEVSSIRAVRSGQKVSLSAVVVLHRTTPIEEADALRDRIEAAVRQRIGEVGEVLVGFCAMERALSIQHPEGRGGAP